MLGEWSYYLTVVLDEVSIKVREPQELLKLFSLLWCETLSHSLSLFGVSADLPCLKDKP